MDKEKLYKKMSESCGHHAIIAIVGKNNVSGYVDVFESRYDNEDEEDSEIRGKGTICFFPDDGEPMLLTEGDIQSIEITD